MKLKCSWPLAFFLAKWSTSQLNIWGFHSLPKTALQPLVDRVAYRHPMWKGSMMNKSDHLALIKSTLSAIPIHTCLILDMPPWFIKALNKIIKAFLWTGTDVMQGGKCVVA
jgi:hypothetical protein